jgi:hypothetical protein
MRMSLTEGFQLTVQPCSVPPQDFHGVVQTAGSNTVIES